MLNFFDPAYQEPPINNVCFGLCDNEDANIAFTDTTDKSKWVATVKNPDRLALTFTAIDNGVIKSNKSFSPKRCDGMLTSGDNLYLSFVELKRQRKEWKRESVLQLVSTIKLFEQTHPGKKEAYTHKRAYVCNKKHPHPNIGENDQELKAKLSEAYGFRLYIQAEIKVTP